jgi:cobyrinic acid a,c-diamide synthase
MMERSLLPAGLPTDLSIELPAGLSTELPAGLLGGPPAGLMIAAPRSGSGKTTLTLGLLRAFRRAGVAVGSAKCGPDYIDPAFHRAASGRPSVNLDSWAMPPALLGELAAQVGLGCDLIICEALMGLFDGVPGPIGRSGSSADVAAALGWPVLLVLDVSGQSQSAAAVVKGCAAYDPRITIAGVVLNRVGSPRHVRLATEAIEALGIPVVGALPRSVGITLPERHLGLVQAGETSDLEVRLEQMATFVTEHAKLDTIRDLATRGKVTAPGTAGGLAVRPPGQSVAVAQDAAFSIL